MHRSITSLFLLVASPALAQDARHADAHEHGVGELNMAIDGNTVAMELMAPGADIVGFEYEAESAEDRAAIDAAVATLARPLDLFILPAAAECSVVQASAGLEGEDDHDDHDHDHDHDDEKHDEHADEKHDDHDDDHAEAEESHTEFHAEYMLTCGNPNALSNIQFAYFDAFENALELEVQIVTASGAKAFEVKRADPTLDLRGMF